METTLPNELLGELRKKLGSETVFEVEITLNRILPMYDIVRREIFGGKDFNEDIFTLYHEYFRKKESAGMSQKTLSQYSYQIKEFIHYINKSPEEATSEDVNNFLDFIKEKRNLSMHSKALRRTILSSFYTWLQINGYIRLNPVKQTEPIKYKILTREALTMYELKQCRKACQLDLRALTMLELFYSTGCRRAEILSIDIQDINWSGRYIRILGKENKERFVFFSVRCSKLLMEYLSGRDKGLIFISKRSPNNPIGKQAIADELRNIGKQAGLKRNLHPHLLRHTFAVMMMEHNVALNDLAIIMGHEDLKTTAIYAKSSLIRLRKEHERAID